MGRATERSLASFCCPHCKGEILLGSGLTAHQRDVLTFIVAFVVEHRTSPSYAQISKGVSFGSRSKAWSVVEQLCQKGFLAKIGGPCKSRNIAVIGLTPGAAR